MVRRALQDVVAYIVTASAVVVIAVSGVLWANFIGGGLAMLGWLVAFLASVFVWKLILPTPRWRAEIEQLADSVIFQVRSLRDQPIARMELLLTIPNGQEFQRSDIGLTVTKGHTFHHQYPHHFTNDPHGFTDTPRLWGRYECIWRAKTHSADKRLHRVAKKSFDLELTG